MEESSLDADCFQDEDRTMKSMGVFHLSSVALARVLSRWRAATAPNQTWLSFWRNKDSWRVEREGHAHRNMRPACKHHILLCARRKVDVLQVASRCVQSYRTRWHEYRKGHKLLNCGYTACKRSRHKYLHPLERLPILQNKANRAQKNWVNKGNGEMIKNTLLRRKQF